MNHKNRRSIRLKGYDYAQEGAYYVTICTQNRVCLFGKVVNGVMMLNEYGKIAEEEWLKTGHIQKNVQLGEFVIIPNHVQGIIIITDGANAIRSHGVLPIMLGQSFVVTNHP